MFVSYSSHCQETVLTSFAGKAFRHFLLENKRIQCFSGTGSTILTHFPKKVYSTSDIGRDMNKNMHYTKILTVGKLEGQPGLGVVGQLGASGGHLEQERHPAQPIFGKACFESVFQVL